MVTKEEYIKRVMLIMNESGLLSSDGSFIAGAVETGIDRHIEGSFVDAWRRCVKVMPRVWFKNASFAGQYYEYTSSDGTGFVLLPDDFYLLTLFRMSGWKKAVYEAYIENDRSASIQSNEYTRGSTIRPVCTISNRIHSGNVVQVLNYYSLPKGLTPHIISQAIYVPAASSLKDISDSSDLGVSEQVLEPLAYLSASTVFTILQKHDISEALEKRAVEMFPGLQSVKGNSITFKQ